MDPVAALRRRSEPKGDFCPKKENTECLAGVSREPSFCRLEPATSVISGYVMASRSLLSASLRVRVVLEGATRPPAG